MRTTCQQNTFNALDSWFLDSELFSFSTDYFNDTLQLYVVNVKGLYMLMHHSSKSAYSVAWETMLYAANECLRHENPPWSFYAIQAQIRLYFKRFGLDAKTALAPLVEYIKAERREYQQENAA